MKKYKQLFFDLDHTLWDFDTNAKESLQELFDTLKLEERGIANFDLFYESYCKHNDILWDRLRKGFIKRTDLRWKRMWHTLLDFKITDTNLSKDMNDFYIEVLPKKQRLQPGTVELLNDLQTKGYPMSLITNGYEAYQIQKMESSGIGQYFDHIITSELAGKPKPLRIIFDYALALTKSKPEDSLMVGDALEIDVVGAQDIGMDAVYYNPAIPPYNGIKPAYVIRDLRELKELL